MRWRAERQVVIAGDASIPMNIQELGILAAYGLPLKVVIVNNHWQGMVRQWQESFYGSATRLRHAQRHA